MKISELIKLHGVPVKVRQKAWKECFWFEVVDDQRTNEYRGFFHDGEADYYNEDTEEWELYVETKPKKKLEAYIINAHGKWFINFGVAGEVFEYFNPGSYKPASVYRAPQFDCEIDG